MLLLASRSRSHPLLATLVLARSDARGAALRLRDFLLDLCQATVEVALELGREGLVRDAGLAVDSEVLVEVVMAGEVAWRTGGEGLVRERGEGGGRETNERSQATGTGRGVPARKEEKERSVE